MPRPLKRTLNATAVTAIALILIGTSGCSTSGIQTRPLSAHPSAKRVLKPRSNTLTWQMAWLRSLQISRVSYGLWFGLDEKADMYEGRAVIRFDLKDLKKSLPSNAYNKLKSIARILALDFEGGQIHSLTINGNPVDLNAKSPYFKTRYDGHRIYFHASELVPDGANRIEIAFSHAYNDDGSGFQRFKDPADGKVYLYTDSEPYGAHKIFPCFDQPDLKASYELTVEAPPEWQVISNTRERHIARVDGRNSWEFPPSPLFSTYLFELAAGPYVSWKDDFKGLPLRLFARKSIKPYVDSKDWFKVTREGLDYYNVYFGYPYPYAKFDQILVPAYPYGGMENVAAVTYSERFAFRSRPTESERAYRAETILHEMAHQWFGDLVTLRWWNSLWLNESFASYMSAKAMAKVTKYPDVWQHFFASLKSWAYWEDQLVTTHPIEVPVPDTEAAEANFDGISYGKGAAALQQLDFYLGNDDFREGLQRYFMNFALRNTTTYDFVRMLSEASGKNLAEWQHLWLETSGVNGLKADWACGPDGKISKFNLIQSPPTVGDAVLRPHRTQIALYDIHGANHPVLRQKGITDVQYSQAVTPVASLIGKRCPSFVYPNHNDYDYVNVELDPRSLQYARKHLSRFGSSFMRQVLWSSLYQMVVDGKMRPQDFLKTFLTQGVTEKDADLLETLISWTTDTSNEGFLLKALPPALRLEYLDKLEAATLKELHLAHSGSDEQKLWFNALIRLAHTPTAIHELRGLLSGQAKLAGFPIDQSERWQLIYALARNNALEAPDLISAEMKRDSSDFGIRWALISQAAIPNPANKAVWRSHFLDALSGKTPVTPDGIALTPLRLREVAPYYLTLFDEKNTQAMVHPFFESVPQLNDLDSSAYADAFTEWLYPSICDSSIVGKTTAVLAKNPDLPASSSRRLKVNRQEEERCVRARGVSAAVEKPVTSSFVPTSASRAGLPKK